MWSSAVSWSSSTTRPTTCTYSYGFSWLVTTSATCGLRRTCSGHWRPSALLTAMCPFSRSPQMTLTSGVPSSRTVASVTKLLPSSKSSRARPSMAISCLLCQLLAYKGGMPDDGSRESREIAGVQLLRTVAQRRLGIVGDLHDDPVRADRGRRARERLHQPAVARRVRGIDDHRQVAVQLEPGDGG